LKWEKERERRGNVRLGEESAVNRSKVRQEELEVRSLAERYDATERIRKELSRFSEGAMAFIERNSTKKKRSCWRRVDDDSDIEETKVRKRCRTDNEDVNGGAMPLILCIQTPHFWPKVTNLPQTVEAKPDECTATALSILHQLVLMLPDEASEPQRKRAIS
jgi:nitrogen fixation protein